MRRRLPRVLLACGLLFFAVPAAASIRGQVVDERGRPLEGASVCLLVSGTEGLCAPTDDAGMFVLPASKVPKMRVRKDGYVPVTLPAATQPRAIVLERAAVLRVTLADKKTGRALPEGQIVVSYTTGRRLGPFPANAGGVRVKSLPRGEIVVQAEAEGYRPGTCALQLVAGQENLCAIELEREAGEGAD